ncbi:hypothetical protein ScPMuIL_009829 [Solemya velum]
MDQFKAPENLVFAGNLHENWRRWEQKLGLYLLASGNNEKDDRTKVAILLHCAGDEAIEIFNNFEFPLKDNGDPDPDDNPDKFEAVLAQFRAYCNPRKNTVIERYNFWMCSQRDGETFDQFVTELRTRAKNCEFGTQTDPMIRDRIIFGINDDRLRERLLRDSADPALSRVIELCRAAEASKKQLQSLQTQSQVPVDSVRVKSTPRGAQKYSETQKTQRHSEHTRPKERIDCKYCGYTHLPRRCPAYGKKCGSCHRKNHFAKMCPSLPKNVSAIHACDSDESDYDLEVDTLFIGELSSDQTRTNKAWFATLGVNGHDVSFKLDTGAEANENHCTVMAASKGKHALSFKILAECSTTKARTCKMVLPHSVVDTPVFMPVGTQGTMKGLCPEQLEDLDCRIILANTYHLGHRPGVDTLNKAGGLHKFMAWNRSLLTDSGGFQMVSLLKLAEITEEGVKFQSPHDGSEMLLTPEKSIEIQNSIGADIMMQLDDVVHSCTTGPRVEEAMHRTVRWLDRCVKANKRPDDQNIFPIVQGGLNPELRVQCAKELTKRDVPGFAIGGLSGGEEKSSFWRMVTISTDNLPKEKPRYLMGVGFAVDLVVCVALGCDMFDCVFPTRTARFGTALMPHGQLNLKNKKYARDFRAIDEACPCSTCKKYTRAYLHTVVTNEPVACSLLTVHNIAYQLRLMTFIRESIMEDKFPEFIQKFFSKLFPKGDYPTWAVEALQSVNIILKHGT